MGMRSTATSSSARTDRIEARVSREQKDLWTWAADLEGCTFTDFVVRALQTAAEQAVQRHQIMRLSAQDTQALVDAIENPREPSERMRRYARRERELLSE